MKRFRLTLLLLAVAYVLIIGSLQLAKYQRGGYNGLDLGIYAQTAWSLAHGHGFANSIHDPTYLGDHLELILVPVAGLYRLAPTPLTLLWTQTLAIAIAGWLIGLLARRHLTARVAWVFSAVFLAHPFVYNVAMYEFHALTLALPLLVAAILFYEQRRWAWWALMLVLIALCREDLPLIGLSWAVLAALDRVPKRWWIGMAVISAAWFALSHQLITQANPLDAYKYSAFIAWLGRTPGAMVVNTVRHPVLFLAHVFHPNNWGTAISLVIGFGLLPLWRPRYLIPAGLSFAQIALVASSPNSVLRIHYTVPFLAFLAWASIIAFRDRRNIQPLRRYDQQLVTALITIFAIVGPLYLTGIVGPAEWPWTARADADLTPASALRQAAATVQPTDRVLTTFALLPWLANRPNLYSLNYVYLGRRQYSEVRYTVPGPIDVAVIDWKQMYDYSFLYLTTDFEGRTGEQRIRDLLTQNHLTPSAWFGSVVVYRRGGSLDVPLTGQPIPATTTTPVLDGSVQQVTTTGRELDIQTLWTVGTAPTKPVAVRFSLRDQLGRRYTTTRLVGEDAQPATAWANQTSRRTTHRLELPLGFQPTSLSVTWGYISGHETSDRWRTFRPKETSFTVLGQTSKTL